MNTKNYNGGLTREQFLFYEIRIVAGLITQGLERDEIVHQIVSQNLFQYPTERMQKTIANGCLRRLDALDSKDLTELLYHASPDVAKQINLYAIMCQNAIVYDFMVDVIGEKFRSSRLDFSVKDVNLFLVSLADKVPAANEWSESTIIKIRQVLVKFLLECEYIHDRKADKLEPVYLYPELEAAIREKCDYEALAAFNCFD